MIINIPDSKYRIRSNESCWELQRRQSDRINKATGKLEKQYKSFNWCETLPRAIVRMTEIMGRDHPLETDSLAEALQTLASIGERVAQACSAAPGAANAQYAAKGAFPPFWPLSGGLD